MIGNVWQWVEDWFTRYTAARAVDPKGNPEGEQRSCRGGGFGGGWNDYDHAWSRGQAMPDARFECGFRVCATAD